MHEIEIALFARDEPDLGPHAVEPMALEGCAVFAERIVGQFDRCVRVFVEERHQGLGQAGEVPLADAGLARIGIAADLVDRGEHLPGVVGVHEGTGAEVDRLAGYRHVVGVHHAMDEADMQPAGDQLRLARGHRLEEGEIRPVLVLDVGIVPVDRVIGEDLHRSHVAARSEELEGADAHVAGCNARNDGAGQDLFAIDRLAGDHGRQRPCRRDAERKHRLADDTLAQHRPERRAPVATA
ncbi:hypothetical protein D9M72_448750 [compost metagenome]